MAARNLVQGWNFARGLNGDDGDISKQVESGKKNFAGMELPGRTLGVVGLGAIGVQVANAAHALGMKVVGYDPDITVQSAWQMSSDVEQATGIDDLLSASQDGRAAGEYEFAAWCAFGATLQASCGGVGLDRCAELAQHAIETGRQ